MHTAGFGWLVRLYPAGILRYKRLKSEWRDMHCMMASPFQRVDGEAQAWGVFSRVRTLALTVKQEAAAPNVAYKASSPLTHLRPYSSRSSAATS